MWAELAALGEMVVAVRNLEETAYNVARALGVLDPEKLNVSSALKRATQQAKIGTPPWANTVTAEGVEAWAQCAKHVFDLRNREVHWPERSWPSDEGWVRVRTSPRNSEEVVASTENELRELADSATQVAVPGRKIWHDLLFEIRPGVYHQHPSLARSGYESMVLTVQSDGGSPDGPIDEEPDDWYDNWRNSMPEEWLRWPEDRYRMQRERKR